MPELKPFLKQLLSVSGLSAYEAPVRDIIAEAWKPLVDELSTSRMGSLHGLRRGFGDEPRKRILLMAHMDAIGLMITGIQDGFLRFTEIGGIDPRILPGQQVTIHAKRDLPGIVVHPASHLLPSSIGSNTIPMKHLYIETGLLPDEVNELITVGDLASFAQTPLELGEVTMSGHSMDNRASVAALTVCLEELQHIRHAWDVWAVASSQEEESFGGAYTSPFTIRPDIGVAMDVTFAKGPGSSDYRSHQMGKGVPLGWGPNIHPALFNSIKDLAEKLDIPWVKDVLPAHSGTDAFAMQVVAEGIPCTVLSIPVRYMHTPVETVSLKDIQRVGHLMAEFIARLKPEFTQKLTWE